MAMLFTTSPLKWKRPMSLMFVKADFDRDANVWYVSDSDIPGLVTEAATFDDLCQKIPIMAAELLSLNGGAESGEVLIEIIAHTTSKVKLAAA